MNFAIIPWQVFLAALQKQQPNALEAWLRRWHFTNEGVLLAHQQIGTN